MRIAKAVHGSWVTISRGLGIITVNPVIECQCCSIDAADDSEASKHYVCNLLSSGSCTGPIMQERLRIRVS